VGKVKRRPTIARGPRDCQRECRAFCRETYALLIALTLCLPVDGLALPQAEPAKAAAALAQKTLAARLMVAIETIRIVRVSPAEWRDSSLGCPERGMTYTPRVVRGFRVRLREDERGREHDVHVAGSRAIVCASHDDARPSATALMGAPLKAREAVRAALAVRLGIDPAGVRVVSMRPAAAGSRDCAAAPAARDGAAFLVDAEAQARSFRYYVDAAVVVDCER
jgi:hypothetical protein